MSAPKIYVACLAAYNNGKLHGEWIDANQDVDSLQDAVTEMLKKSPEHTEDLPCEEYAIHDFEGFEGFPIKEYMDLETVSKAAQAIAENGQAFALYASDVGLEAALDNFQDAYMGEYKDKETYAWEIVEQTMEIPENILPYFDIEKFARDLSYDVSIHDLDNGNIVVFSQI